jgi:hypothetical protein
MRDESARWASKGVHILAKKTPTLSSFFTLTGRRTELMDVSRDTYSVSVQVIVIDFENFASKEPLEGRQHSW